MLDAVNASQPAVPRSKADPNGQGRRLASAMQAVRSDIVRARDMVLRAVEGWHYTITNEWTTNAFYQFQVDASQLDDIVAAIQVSLARGDGPEAVRQAAMAAYREGVARTVGNLSGMTSDYPFTILERLGDAEVLRRASIAGSRVFEQMQGFSGQAAQDLARVLFDAVQSGENPRQTAKTIRERFAVSYSRALRIARTEINMAQRRARWDEALEAELKFGLKTKLLHTSAMIFERTRESHAERHGRLYTREEISAWYAVDGNAINCLCSQTEVVVDAAGQPLLGRKLIERMGAQRDQFLGRKTKPELKPEKAPPKPRAAPKAPPKAQDPVAKIKAGVLASQPIFAGGYDTSFNAAPALVWRAIAKAGDLRELRSDKRSGAYADFTGLINMGKHAPKTAEYRTVFRHEYGHFVDLRIAQALKSKASGGTASPKAFAPGRFASFRAVDDLAADGKELQDEFSGASLAPGRIQSAEMAAIQEAQSRQAVLSRKLSDELYDYRDKTSGSIVSWMDEKLKADGITAAELLGVYGRKPEDLSTIQAARLIAAWQRRDAKILLQSFPEELNVRVSHANPLSGLQDTVEASTPKAIRMPFGHGSQYYSDAEKSAQPLGLIKRIASRTYSGYNTGQAFANWFEAMGSATAAVKIYAKLWPRTHKRFTQLVEEFLRL